MASTRPTQPTDPQQRRGLGLDKPCSKCGKEIYYGYSGPYEGICGRCTDKVIAQQRRTRSRTVRVTGRRGVKAFWFWILLAFAAGAAAGIILYPFLGL